MCEAYANQTVLPDEITISLSGCKHVDNSYINDVTETKWPFPVRFIYSDTEKSESINRNLAAKIAKGDLLICHDADDLPHPQRVEVIKYFFENYNIVHLLHGCIHSKINFEKIENLGNIPWYNLSSIGETFSVGFTLVNGPCAVLRSTWNEFKWDNSVVSVGSDIRFNSTIYEKHSNTIVIDALIYQYVWSKHSIYHNKIKST